VGPLSGWSIHGCSFISDSFIRLPGSGTSVLLIRSFAAKTEGEEIHSVITFSRSADIAFVVLDYVRFRHSACIELRGFEHKFLPPYSSFFNGLEWKHYVKVGLQGHRARDEADLQERIRAFELVPAHATAYCSHTGNTVTAYH